MNKKIEVYYSSKSKVLYVMMPNGKSYFVTNKGEVGETYGNRGMRVNGSFGGSSTYDNATLVCDLTPSVIRKVKKIFG